MPFAKITTKDQKLKNLSKTEFHKQLTKLYYYLRELSTTKKLSVAKWSPAHIFKHTV